MFKFLKWLYLDIWLPVNFHFSVLYGQIVQLKFLAELMVIVGLGWLYLTGHILTHKQLLGVFAVLFLLGTVAGYGLVRLGIPQRGNKLANSVNKEFMEIIDRLDKIEKKL